MASILSSSAARAAALLFMAATANALSNPVYQGCYSISTPMKEQGTYQYQTSGWCQGQCAPLNQAVLGLSNANQCWCGNEVPPLSAKVDDSSCNTPCDGYDSDICGGQGFWSVYSTGITDSVQHYSGSVSTGSSSSPSSSVTKTSSATPSVITKVSGTTVIVVTQTPTSTGVSSQSKSGKGSVNTAGIAAGVVVAVVVVTGAIAGLFIWLRYRKRRDAEEDYKRAQVAELARSAEHKAPATSWSGTSDSRLEPALDRRNSFGSIADNEDYSRKILRVANPDRSSAFQPERSSIFPPERSAWPPQRL